MALRVRAGRRVARRWRLLVAARTAGRALDRAQHAVAGGEGVPAQVAAAGRLPPGRLGLARAARTAPAHTLDGGAGGAAVAARDAARPAGTATARRGPGRFRRPVAPDPGHQAMSSTKADARRRRPFLISALPRTAAARTAAQSPTAAPGRLQTAVLLVLAAALSGFTILRGIAPHDEGLMLQAGSRIASGQWPYRDFWMNYPPGQPLVLALLHEVFGASLLAW